MPGARIATDGDVTLRSLEAEDLPFLQRSFTNPEIRYPIGNPLKTRTDLEERHEDGDTPQFLVCLDDAGPGTPDEEVERIGAASVDDVDWRRPDLGYWLKPEVHGQGYGKAAVSLVVDYVFRTYDHPAVGACAYEFNEASRGLLESLGFEEEGLTRRDRFIDGEYVDTVQYVLLREDWRA